MMIQDLVGGRGCDSHFDMEGKVFILGTDALLRTTRDASRSRGLHRSVDPERGSRTLVDLT